MAGSKNASKTSSKSVASNGQKSLLHFYKREAKPVKDAANIALAVNTVTTQPAPEERPDPPVVPPPVEMATSSSLSVDTKTKEHRRLDGSTVDPDAPQEPLARHETSVPCDPAVEKDFILIESVTKRPSADSLDVEPLQQPDLGSDNLQGSVVVDATNFASEPTTKLPPAGSSKGKQSQQPLLSDDLQEPIVVDSSNSPSIEEIPSCADKPLPKELHPIFKRRLAPSSPQRRTTKPGRPAISHTSSSNLSLLESHGKSSSKKAEARPNFQDVVDLTKSSQHGESTISPIIIIDDGPELRGSQDAPIELPSSPPPQSQQKKVVHPFFARRSAKRKDGEESGMSQLKISSQMQTPWPDAEMQHTRGPQGSFRPSASSPFSINSGSPRPASLPSRQNLQFLKNQVTLAVPESRPYTLKAFVPTPLEREEIISRIPDSHRVHSAISRLLDLEPESLHATENGEVWAHKWRPRRAAEVLGNDESIRYVKDWLHALEIRTGQTIDESPDAMGRSAAPSGACGTKRPVILRAVEKKRGRKRRRIDSDDGSSIGDWIVDEEEEESAIEYASEDEFLACRSSPYKKRVSESLSERQRVDERLNVGPPSHDDEYRPLELSQLTNTILLAGPCGSGKTSAVYACAEELGWEVFEVYPGIGRRSGANVSSLVGEVGKNHLVGRREASGSNAQSASIQRSFIRSGFGFLAEEGREKSDAGGEDGSRTVRQSIILLEEVDVLFKEDASFWPAVVNLIKSSHRPVFMTCNDLSLVPRHDLPLQATLFFEPCPAPLAISFLQSVCLAEGRSIPREQLDAMYETTYELIGPDEPDEPQVPFPSQAPACSDLRRVLNELQFWCRDNGDAKNLDIETEIPLITAGSSAEVLADWSRSSGPSGGSSPDERSSQENDIFLLWKHSEYASYVDGYLERRSSDVLEALAIDRYEPSADDELGHTLLSKPSVVDNSTSLSFYSADEMIAREALIRSRHVFETSGVGPRARTGLLGNERGATLESRSLVRGRAANQKQVVLYLDDVIPLFAPLLPRAPAILDYAAYLRQMVSVDDATAAKETAADVARSTREIRRRWRPMDEERHLDLSVAGLEAARETRLA